MTNKEEKRKIGDNEVQHEKLNEGIMFTVPTWSYGKHKRVVKRLAQAEAKNGKPFEKDIQQRLFENFVIIESLTEAKVEISEEIIDSLHPNDRLELYAICYMCGRKGMKGDVGNFRNQTEVKEEGSKE